MTQRDDHAEETPDETSQDHGYFRRDVEAFYREANVLAGHDPRDVTAEFPANLRLRRLLVFGFIVVAGVLAVGLAIGLMSLPSCENPQYNWMPCIPDLGHVALVPGR